MSNFNGRHVMTEADYEDTELEELKARGLEYRVVVV